MPALNQTSLDILDSPPDKTLVFVGQPGQLRGNLHLINRSDKRLTLRRMHLGISATKPARKGESPEEAISLNSLPRVVLQPGQRQRVEVGLALEPHTPPGEYTGVIDMGGRQQSVILHVTEKVQLDLSPTDVILENRSGAVITKRVVFTNEGNVPLTINGFGAVPLDRQDLECFAMRNAVHIPEGFDTVDRYITEVLLQAKQIMDETGILRVRSTQGPVIIQPGEVKAVDLEIQIPEGLNKRSRYRGKIAIYTSDLNFIIVPAQSDAVDDTPEEKENAKQTRAKK